MVHFIWSLCSEHSQPLSPQLVSSASLWFLLMLSYAARRVCVRDGTNWVCIITNCCKGKSMKVKASGSCGTHPWRRHTHIVCCHIFKANSMSTFLQQLPFFTLNHGKSPSPTKGKDLSPVLHALLKRRRKDHSNKAYSLSPCHTGLKLQMFTCWTWAIPFPLQLTQIQNQNQPF